MSTFCFAEFGCLGHRVYYFARPEVRKLGKSVVSNRKSGWLVDNRQDVHALASSCAT